MFAQGTFVVTSLHLLFEPDPDSDDEDDQNDNMRHYRRHVHGHGTVPDTAPLAALPGGAGASLASDQCEIVHEARQAQQRRSSIVAAGGPGSSPHVSQSASKRRRSRDSGSGGGVAAAHLASPAYSAQPRRWQLAYIVRILPRRYLLKRCAVEFFFTDNSSAFVAFAPKRMRAVWDAVWAQRPLRLSAAIKSLKPSDHFKAWGIQERWRRREVSNFDYLMALNLCAGRSFNDLTQYPVMPWVISDYQSKILDLNDPRTFRDLSKPVGALNPKRLAAFRDRMEALRGGDIKPFMYGSHYSNAGAKH
jgi:hypothetical protein